MMSLHGAFSIVLSLMGWTETVGGTVMHQPHKGNKVHPRANEHEDRTQHETVQFPRCSRCCFFVGVIYVELFNTFISVDSNINY